MSNEIGQALSVSIRELPTIFVAYTHCHVDQAAGNFSDQIRDGFQNVKDWVMQKGHDLSGLKVIGVPHIRDSQLTGYECCVELPKTEDVNTGTIQTKQLTGGKYAVLTLEKDSATIGETIGRFFADYVPAHQLIIDNHRPSYEIYDEHLMDFCVPIS